MHEDVAGEREAGLGRHYLVCAECGRTFLATSVSAHSTGLTENSRSEFNVTCAECERLLQRGEGAALVDDV